MNSAYEYSSDSHYFDEQNGLSNYAQDFAFRLKEYGEAVISGGFSIINKVEEIIKERAFPPT